MFIPTINTGGREVPFSTPLGREAESLMGHPLSFYEGVQRNKQTNNKLWIISLASIIQDHESRAKLVLASNGSHGTYLLQNNNFVAYSR